MDGESQLLAEKDAEIERLKAQVKELSEAYQKAIGPIRPAQKDAIIQAQKIHCEGQSAEIARLKAENTALKMSIVEFQALVRDNNALITELADALEEGDGDGFFITENIELIQRAREATK